MAERTLARLIHRASFAFGPGDLTEEEVLRLIRAYASVRPRRVRWAIEGRIPCLRPILAACRRYLPPYGRVLDLGCGYGLVLQHLAATRPDPLWGVEKDASRAKIAREGLRRWPQVQVVEGDLAEVEWPPASGILLLDVLFMIPPVRRRSIADQCARKLGEGGIVLVKDTATFPRWKYAYTRIEERIKMRCKVYGDATSRELHYFHGAELDEMFLARGFTKIAESMVPNLTPYPGVFYVYRRS